MIPLKLTLAGFMSYREAQTLDFKDDSLWVLAGKNASGKSSIFDAIIFALFGETRVKGIKNASLVNNQSDGAEITFDFAVGKTLYRVHRIIDKEGETKRDASLLLQGADGELHPDPIPGTTSNAGFNKWMEDEIGLNYGVFVASVLLRQGKADAFLEASTEDRYEVLDKLIDLSKYKALAEKARSEKKTWTDRTGFYRDSLSRMSPATEADLADALAAISTNEGAASSAQELADQLQTLFGQASQWERMDAELREKGRRVEELRLLLAHAEDITRSYQRLVELRRVLPGLRAILDLAADIHGEEEEVRRLAGEWNDNDALIKAKEPAVKELEQDNERKAKLVRDINTESGVTYCRLTELTPTIRMIDQVGQLQEALRKHDTELGKYPENLDELLRTSEARRDQLLEAKGASGDLTRLASERKRLLASAQRLFELTQLLQQKTDSRPAVHQAKLDAQAAFEAADAFEKAKSSEMTEARTLHGAALQRLANFNQVVDAVVCKYCGSDLSPEHKAAEHQRLDDDLEKRAGAVTGAERAHSDATEVLRLAREKRDRADRELSLLDGSISSTQQSIEEREREINGQLTTIATTYDALPNVYQGLVSISKPASVEEWRATVFPQESDLAAIQASIRQIPLAQTEAKSLSDRVVQRNQARTRRASAKEQLDDLQSGLPDNWKELAAEEEMLRDSASQISSRLEKADQDASTARDIYNAAAGELATMRDEQARRESAMATTRTSLSRNRSNLSTKIAQLPGSWQPIANEITEEQISKLDLEMDSLADCEEPYHQLSAAEQTLNELAGKQRVLQEIVDALPVEARRPAEQVSQALTEAREQSRQADERLGLARTRYDRLLTQRDQYQAAETSMKEAARKAHLYGILSDHFSERGIQKAIINKAETSIVRLANQMLDSLSGGRSKLRLRQEGGNKKAMDLEVWDSQTGGNKPIVASLASGSQRFRIAISLALGIGQYIGNESNRIESVIIDEGFGSLDREGRESIIQELYNLSNHLKRIILVSHQEEFLRGFSTGYEVQLVDGASQIRPMIQ